MSIRVLFVCLGNICRSPMAKGIFLQKVEVMGLSHKIVVDSCGTGNYHVGQDAHPLTLATLRKNGIHLSHVVRQLVKEDFQTYHYLIAMDRSNEHNMKLIGSPSEHSKIFLMRTFDLEKDSLDVPDPYFGADSGFDVVYDILNRSSNQLLSHIITREFS